MWLLLFGVGPVLVRAGLGLIVGGSVQPRMAANALLRGVAEAAAAVLAFWIVGAPLLLGRGRFVAFSLSLIMATDVPATAFFHAALATFGGAVVAGAIAGRARFHVSVVASAMLGGVVFPMVGYLVWFGHLRQLNVVDFGGATAVHLTAAVFASVGVAAIGSRAGRYAAGAPIAARPIEGLPLAAAGVAMVVVGWVPYLLASLLAHPTDFNPMSDPSLAVPAMSVAAMNSVLAAAAGGVGGILYSRFRYGRADLRSASLGMMGGLVSITAACVAMGSLGAVMTAGIAGALVPAAAGFMDRRARLDDAAGLIAVNGIGALWGMVATAMFAAGPGGLSAPAHFRLVAVQALATAVTLAFAAVMAGVTFGLLRLIGPLRATTD